MHKFGISTFEPKILLRYLKKIIWEYDLFELEEDGYFMPKELNPPRKKEGENGKK